MKYSIFTERGFGWLVSIILIIASKVCEKIPPKFTEFYEADIALSYTVHDTVPYRYVIITCYIIPTILISIYIYKGKPRAVKEWIHDCIYLAARTFGTNEILICLLKNFIGRPRPCFFHLCGYEKTTNVLPSGQTVTTFGTFGVLGDVSKCSGTTKQIYAAFRSFPSGHSATAASGTMIAILYLFHYIQNTTLSTVYKTRFLKTVCSVPLIFWACFIFGSRIFDYRHRPEDVVGGIVFGSLSALYVWILHYPTTSLSNCKSSVTLFDNSGKDVEYTKVVVVSCVC